MNLTKVLAEAESIYDQLKVTGDAVPLNVRQIIGLAPPKEHDSENSDEDSFTHTMCPTAPTFDSVEAVTLNSDIDDIAFETIDRAMSSNYY